VTLQSITVLPATATVLPGQGQSFQAFGHFSDGSIELLPAGNGNPPLWSVVFDPFPGINVSACATSQHPAPLMFGSQVFLDHNGAVQETWSPGTPVVSVTGTIDQLTVSLALACTNAAATGSVHASWNGTAYTGTFTFNGGASTGTVSITRSGGTSLPTVQWSSTNPFVANVDPSGFAQGYMPGQTTIVASAGNVSCAPDGCATLTVIDGVPPHLSLPNDMTVQAFSPSGQQVTWFASAYDNVDGQQPVICDPPSGSVFGFGPTTVQCSASDLSGNTANGSFTITVVDTNPPFLSLPNSPHTREATSAAGAVVTYFASANDSVDGPITPSCSPASGSTFPLGPTTVNCSVSDSRGNTRTGSFTVSVVDTTAPMLSLPADIVVNATSTAGAIVTFAASAVDLVDGAQPVECTPASGSVFLIGTTTVACSAGDTRGNVATGTFTVTVLSPSQIVATLVSEIESFPQAANLLENVLKSIAQDNISAACGQLTAFINQVAAQRGKKLTEEEADALSRAATDARAALGCS
jgi:hypothetical protein